MSFTAPWNLLWAIIITGVAVWGYRVLDARNAAQAREYSSLPFMNAVAQSSVRWEKAIAGIFLAGIASLGIALAGPHLSLRLPISDGTVVICVDTSGSMQSGDVSPTRAQAAVEAIHRFVRELGPTVRVGIVTFATDAQVVTQPTADRQVLSDAIDTIPHPNGATAIGDALNLAGQILPKSGRRAIILITDGVNNRGADPLEAAHDLAGQHVPIFTVGIGTPNSGQVVPGTSEEASIDPDALAQLAQITGGTATMAADADAIVGAFSTLARSSIWETQRVDASVILAVLGGSAVAAAFFLRIGLGILP